MQMQVNLSEKSAQELEQIGYQLYKQLDFHKANVEQISKNLNLLSQELEKRARDEAKAEQERVQAEVEKVALDKLVEETKE